MKRIQLLLIFMVALSECMAQITANRDYTVYYGGPDLVLNAIPQEQCTGSCSSIRTCTASGYEGTGVTLKRDKLVCQFIGAYVINEMLYRDTYQISRASGECELRSSTSDVGDSFTVRGIDFKWNASLGIQCPSAAPINLSTMISDAIGTVFSGPGVSGNTFSSAAAGPGTYTITATKTYDNGTISRTTSVTVVRRGQLAVSNVAVCSNASTSILATVESEGVNSFQWQESADGGNVWGNLSNTGIYSGTNTLALRMASVASWMSGYQYRLVIHYSCGPEVALGTTTVTVIASPVITLDPVSTTVCESEAARFMVESSGEGVTCQWQYSPTGGAGSFSDVSGATSLAYTIGASQLSQEGFYRAVMNNSCSEGGLVSQAARLIVRPLTRITSAPTDKSICPEGSATYYVGASGAGTLSYQWESSTNNGQSFLPLTDSPQYQGTVSNSLTLNNVFPSMGNQLFRVKVSGECGNVVTSAAGRLTVYAIPSSPSVTNPSRCGDGPLTATANSPVSSPVYKWYANTDDAVPVFTGPSYQVSNLIVSTRYYVSVSSQGCESPRQQAVLTHYAPKQVPLGMPLSLCVGQGTYNLEADIADPSAKGSNFTWTSGNGTRINSKLFDPAIGAGSYPVTYDPPATAKVTPSCYVQTVRTVTVMNSGGEGGIVFNSELVSNGRTINMCVGDRPIDIAAFPSISAGTWNAVSGSGLSYSGQSVVFTPDQSSYTEVVPNVFRYTVQVNGCTASKDLEVFVKDNPHTPVVTGLPGVVCPGKVLPLAASVSSPGTFTYEWYRSGDATPLAVGSNLSYTVDAPVTLQVRSINSPFGCRSEATLIPIATPFNSGSIEVSRSTLPTGEYVNFMTSASDAGNSFQWNFGDGAVSSEKNPSHYYYTIGAYTVTLSIQSSLGCGQTISYDKITVWGDSSNGPIMADEKSIASTVHVYPNPTNDELRIESERPILSCILIDLTGRRVGYRLQENTHGISLSTASLKAGVYLLQLQTSKGLEKIKVIKRE